MLRLLKFFQIMLKNLEACRIMIFGSWVVIMPAVTPSLEGAFSNLLSIILVHYERRVMRMSSLNFNSIQRSNDETLCFADHSSRKRACLKQHTFNSRFIRLLHIKEKTNRAFLLRLVF